MSGNGTSRAVRDQGRGWAGHRRTSDSSVLEHGAALPRPGWREGEPISALGDGIEVVFVWESLDTAAYQRP